MQDAGRLMRTPVRIDIGSMGKKKVGDLELVVKDSPPKGSVENLLRIGALAEPTHEF